MLNLINLLRVLSDGEVHSVEELSACSRGGLHATLESIHKLVEMGIEIDVIADVNYRLRYPLELLDAAAISAELAPDIRAKLTAIQVFPELDSTNSYLMRQAAQAAPGTRVCLAEYQSLGKGRRGRRWVSPFGKNLYLSLLWEGKIPHAELSGLSTMIGVSVAGALRSVGVGDVGVKWPNDIIWRGRKLGGILVELTTNPTGLYYVVIGVGINISMPPYLGHAIDQPWINLNQILRDSTLSRNRLATKIIEALVNALQYFERWKLAETQRLWPTYDCTYGKWVELRLPDKTVTGVALGIDELGRLKLRTDGGLRCYSAGEISLRVKN